jgi:transketolase
MSSQLVLNKMAEGIPELVGGSADLTGSNLTKAESMTPFSNENPAGNYIHYGIKEHAMSAMMNGMSLHKGTIPYGGTFLIFSDYCRHAIRMSALM